MEQLLADVLDVGIHRPGVPEIVVTPHLAEDLFPVNTWPAPEASMQDLHPLG